MAWRRVSTPTVLKAKGGTTTEGQPSLIITLIIGTALGGLAGFLASLLANAVYSRILRPNLTIELDPTNPDPATRPSVGPHAFYHVLTISPDQPVPIFGHRRIPRSARARVAIMDTAHHTTYVDDEARWAGWPAPTALVPMPSPGGLALQEYFDPKEMARQRSFDFESPGQREQVDIVLKIEGDDHIYFWNNRSYEHGATYVRHALGQGDFDVRVTLTCEGSRRFLGSGSRMLVQVGAMLL